MTDREKDEAAKIDETGDPDCESYPGCEMCPASGNWDKCPCHEWERWNNKRG